MPQVQLAQVNPAAYLPDVATTLNNLAAVYSNTERVKEAEEAHQQALAIRRQLVQQKQENRSVPDTSMGCTWGDYAHGTCR